MNYSRYYEIEVNHSELTDTETKEGWHFCPEWDYMLIGPNCQEIKTCLCDIIREPDE